MNRNTILLIFLSLSMLLPAQSGKYLFSHLSVNDGLSHNRVNSILKDSKGFMWFGTMSGLNRYDGHSFKVYKHSLSNSNSINGNFIRFVYEDHKGNLWVQTHVSFNVYNPEKEHFSSEFPEYLKNIPIKMFNVQKVYKDNKNNFWILHSQGGPYCFLSASNKIVQLNHIENNSSSIASNDISAIAQDSQGFYWMINKEGIIEKVDGKTFEVVFRNYAIKTQYNIEYQDYSLFVDSDDHLWVVMNGFPSGLFWYNTKNNSINYLNKENPELKLNTNYVSNIAQDTEGIIWIGTDQGGVNLFDKKSKQIRYLLHSFENEKSISQNTITSIYRDSSGIMWLGTFKEGINFYHHNLIRFRHLKHEPGNPASLPTDDVHCFAEDKNGDVWIGTNGNGLIKYNRKLNTYKQYRHIPGNPNSLSNDIIVTLHFDKEGILWIGTYFGGLIRFDGKNFKTFKHNPNDKSSLSDDRVWDIFEDSRGNFWVATLGGGLNQFDKQKNIFYHYAYGDNNSVHSNFLVDIAEDAKGNLWIGSSEGVDVLDISKNKFIRIVSESGNPNSLSNSNVVCIASDKKGKILVGTHDGLNLFDTDRNLIKIFKEQDGLPDNAVVSIVEDRPNSFWIGTTNKISNLVFNESDFKKNFVIRNYDKSDGLQGKEFNERAAIKVKSGEILFGGALGINIFIPKDIKDNKEIPNVVLSNLFIFNKPVKVNDTLNNRVVLRQSLINTNELKLKHKENVFTIEFAALNYLHPEKSKFRYTLEGFNSDWLNAEAGQYRATYTNIDPGDYTFRVIASNDDGYWNEKGAILKIHISPPWYRSILAYVIYAILLLAILLTLRRMILQGARMKFAIEHERHEAQRMHEIDMMKIKFFTNVSHEFRTPLSLIITPVEKIIKNTQDTDQKKQFTLIHRNAKRLLNLVNQLLDLRRMEVQEFNLNQQPADIVAFVKETTNSFSDISENKNIQLSFLSSVKEQIMYFDQDKMEKILFNLLSNAFKFTLQGGQVSVELDYKELDKDQLIEIRVRDTGIGIPEDKKEKIFEQFFQNELPGNIINQGSGIGLAITREFVKLHKGQIFVESTPSVGSCFIVQLPIGPDTIQNPLIEKPEPVLVGIEPSFEAMEETKLTNRPTVLLVEDNEDLRFYLKDNLKNKFRIVEAANGTEALSISKEIIPDIIVSDITMPGIDGLELCKKLKQEKQTSHIPIILLTARTSEEQKIEGIKSGADDYITKPFNFEILESRIDNLISQREILRKSFQKHISIDASEVEITSLDEKLIQKALDIVEKSISNPDFSVEELSQSLGMSRVHLYKKLLAITGKTPIEFIRIVRLKRAAQLLLKSQMTVSEIAYEVGFNSPKYFARYFREEFNVLPSQYAEKNKSENPG